MRRVKALLDAETMFEDFEVFDKATPLGEVLGGSPVGFVFRLTWVMRPR